MDETKKIMVDSDSFAKLLKDTRKRKGYSQRKLAEIIGVSNSTIARWETGKVLDLDIINLYKATKILQINFFYILTVLIPMFNDDYRKDLEILELVNNMSGIEYQTAIVVLKALSVYYNSNPEITKAVDFYRKFNETFN